MAFDWWTNKNPALLSGILYGNLQTNQNEKKNIMEKLIDWLILTQKVGNKPDCLATNDFINRENHKQKYLKKNWMQKKIRNQTK